MLKQYLTIEALKSFLTKRHGNAGRERLGGAGLSRLPHRSISKALTWVFRIGTAYGALSGSGTVRGMAHHRQSFDLDVDDRLRHRG